MNCSRSTATVTGPEIGIEKKPSMMPIQLEVDLDTLYPMQDVQSFGLLNFRRSLHYRPLKPNIFRAPDRLATLRHQQQADSMQRHYASSTGVDVGAVVTIKVDVRDRSNHNQLGLMGITVHKSQTGSNSILVATKAGVLVGGARKKPIYWSPEQYMVCPHPTLEPELASIQEEVLAGTYDVKAAFVTTVANAHRVVYGGISTRRGRCRCKDGDCTFRCGCHRNGLVCSSSCTCNGNCTL